ncbi:MAG: hypothetical protein MK213_05750, partial [Planctomycetes bacterium]|nr:hypothetical protein [Planctomycetota bacterium]
MTLLPFFLTLALVPQEVELPLPGCKRCDFSGVVECKKHPKDLLAMEAEVLFCSIAAECKSCAGALRVDCTRCDGGPDSQAVEDRRKEVQAWLEKPRALDDFLGVPIPRLETEYLMVEGDVEVLRESKKKVTGHELLHRVARDGEKVCAMVAGHFGAKRKDYRSPLKLWFWEKAETHRKVMGHFLGSGSAGDFKWLGKEPRFSVHCADSTFQSDA